MGKTRHEVATRTDDLVKAAKPMGLEVNQDKAKYLVVSRRNERRVSNPIVGNLGANINRYNDTHNEIELRITAANSDYYASGKSFEPKLPSRRSKERRCS